MLRVANDGYHLTKKHAQVFLESYWSNELVID